MNKNRLLGIAQIFLLATTLVFAILWIRNPQGNYEPWTVVFGSVLLAFLEIFRQTSQQSNTKTSAATDEGSAPPLLTESRPVTTPGTFRYILDQCFPKAHSWLTTQIGLFEMPPEWSLLHNYLSTLRSIIANDIREKTYVEPRVKALPESANRLKFKRTGFLTPIQQLIKEIVGVSHGGDAQNAQISAISRKSKFVRNIVNRLLHADEPLILLGDPGTGKSITLQQAAMLIAEKESKRLFPKVCLFIRLGEFQVSGEVNSQTVWDYVKKSTPQEIRPFLESLDTIGRLVIFFDGMDEMSRERYNEHTTALSVFAGSRKGVTKTLFSCRITDFTPRFQHNRLVLLPFSRTHIYRYLKRQIPRFPIEIGGKSWSARQLAKRLVQGDLPMQADNPFVLWLLCDYLQVEQDWPKSRVHLLEYYNRSNYERKIPDASQTDELRRKMNRAFLTWGRIAYEITDRNKGATIPLEDVKDFLTPEELPAVQVGMQCGVLEDSKDMETTLIRFKHHRFQEYFTALYLNNNHKSELNWLDKLDAPRWQETLVNLVLMGGGQEALIALGNAIKQGLAQLKRVKTTRKTLEVAQVETRLADRVELASRVLQQIQQQSDEGFNKMATTFRRAVYLLSDHGNPITKVKMLWASKIVPGIDIFRVAHKSLSSDVSWVRQQALIITSVAGEKVGSSALQEDVLHSFASGRFLNRLGGFVRIASVLKQRRFWYILVIGFTFYLFQLLAGYGLVATAHNMVIPIFSALKVAVDKNEQRDLDRQKDEAIKNKDEEKLTDLEKSHEKLTLSQVQHETVASAVQKSLDSRWFLFVVPTTMLITLLYTLRHAPEYHFLTVQSVGYIWPLLPFIWWPLWLGYWSVMREVLTFVLFFVAAMSVINWALTLIIHILVLTLFSASAYNLIGQTLKKRMLLEAMWENCGFKDWGKMIIEFGGFILISCLSMVTLFVDTWKPIWEFIVATFGLLPFLPSILNIALSVSIYVGLVGCVISLVLGLKKGWGQQNLELLLAWIGVGLTLSFVVLLIWAFINWQNIWEFILATIGLFPFFPPIVNVAFSVAIYAEIIGCVVTLFSRLEKKGHRQSWDVFLPWTGVCLGMSIVVLLIWGLSLLNWKHIGEFIAATFGLFSFFPPIVNASLSVVIYAELIGCIVSLVSGLKKQYQRRRQSLKMLIRWTRVCLGLVMITFLGWGIFTFPNQFARILSIILFLAPAVVLIIFFKRIMRDMVPFLEVLHKPLGHAKYTSETWKQELRKRGPDFQATQLKRTTPNALDLPVKDFLALLQEIERYVKEEPALSAYWAKRYEIEQIIHQERIG